VFGDFNPGAVALWRFGKRKQREGNAMPAGYIVWFKPRRGLPWAELGRAATMFEALAFMNTSGKFWLQTIRDGAATPIEGTV